MNLGKLYLVPVPIGNLKDITLRGKELLFKNEIIFCENTRKTFHLLQALSKEFNQKLPESKLVSFFEGNEKKRIGLALKMLKEGQDLILVSNAGSPLLSDPGFKLVEACSQEEIVVEALPGANALIPALSCSGLPMNKFVFLGFLPRKKSKQEKVFADLKNLKSGFTIAFYESPFRLKKTLLTLSKNFDPVKAVVVKDLTKRFEQLARGTFKNLATIFSETKKKGEFVILFHLSRNRS